MDYGSLYFFGKFAQPSKSKSPAMKKEGKEVALVNPRLGIAFVVWK